MKSNSEFSKIRGNVWKEKDEKYLFELQKFLDRVDNIKDERFKSSLVHQMLNCDKALTELSEKMFEQYYEIGYNNGLKNKV